MDAEVLEVRKMSEEPKIVSAEVKVTMLCGEKVDGAWHLPISREVSYFSDGSVFMKDQVANKHGSFDKLGSVTYHSWKDYEKDRKADAKIVKKFLHEKGIFVDGMSRLCM